MSVHLELWHLITLLLAFFGAAAGWGRLLLQQIDKRLDERFAVQEQARADTRIHWDDRFATLELASEREGQNWQRIERELLKLQADLPLQYVRREDYLRNQTVIEAKLDGLALRLENMQLRSGNG